MKTTKLISEVVPGDATPSGVVFVSETAEQPGGIWSVMVQHPDGRRELRDFDSYADSGVRLDDCNKIFALLDEGEASDPTEAYWKLVDAGEYDGDGSYDDEDVRAKGRPVFRTKRVEGLYGRVDYEVVEVGCDEYHIVVEVWPPHEAFGETQPAEVSWPSTSDKRPALARALADALVKAADEADRMNADVKTR